MWREYAEHVSQSLAKGSRVIAQGRLKQRAFETAQGEKRTVIELEVDEIGPSLRYATAAVTRSTGGDAGRSQAPAQAAPFVQAPQAAPAAEPWGSAQPGGGQPGGDVWGAPGTTYSDETPF